MKFMETNHLPKVSVLIPAYNEEKYILKALECIIQQDYANYEVIVIDNASTDQTSTIVREFIEINKWETHIKLIYEGRKGTQYAREAGRKQATGSIIAQIDADCLPLKNWIKKGVKELKGNRIVAVSGPYDYFDSPFFIRLLTLLSQFSFLKAMNSFVQFARRGAILIGGNILIKAEVLEKSGGYNTSLSFYGDDVDMALKASSFGKVVFCNRLVMKTSSRRYSAQGFFKVQAKYNHFFFRSVFHQPADSHESIELMHPR